MSLEENPQQNERRDLISRDVAQLCDGLGLRVEDERILFYSEALDDLTPKQLEHGFTIAKRNLGAFLPTVEQLRHWCESWRPPGFNPFVAEKSQESRTSEFQRVGELSGEAIEGMRRNVVKLKITRDEVMQWLEDGKQAQQEHYAKLSETPEWQELYELHGKPGLSPRPSRNWDSEEAKAQWASETAKSQGWAK